MVRGETTAGAIVDIAVSRRGSRNVTSVVQVVAGTGGGFRVTLPTPRAHTVVTVTATTGSHASGWAQQTVTRR